MLMVDSAVVRAGAVVCVLASVGVARAQSVAIYPFSGRGGVPVAATRGAEGYVREAVSRIPGVKVQPEQLTEETIQAAARAGTTCEESILCKANLAKSFNVDVLLVGLAEPSPTGMKVNLTSIDVKAGQQKESVTVDVPLSGADLLQAMRQAAFTVLGKNAMLLGGVEFRCPQGVVVDIEEYGELDCPVKGRGVIVPMGKRNISAFGPGLGKTSLPVHVRFEMVTLVDVTREGTRLKVVIDDHAVPLTTAAPLTATPMPPRARIKMPTVKPEALAPKPEAAPAAEEAGSPLGIFPLAMMGVGAGSLALGVLLGLVGTSVAGVGAVAALLMPKNGLYFVQVEGEPGVVSQLRVGTAVSAIPLGVVGLVAGVVLVGAGVGLALVGVILKVI
jgi:hypothetical protein